MTDRVTDEVAQHEAEEGQDDRAERSQPAVADDAKDDAGQEDGGNDGEHESRPGQQVAGRRPDGVEDAGDEDERRQEVVADESARAGAGVVTGRAVERFVGDEQRKGVGHGGTPSGCGSLHFVTGSKGRGCAGVAPEVTRT